MISLKNYLTYCSLLAIVISCKSFQDFSEDFTDPYVFTKGVEGPAVDQQGNLYAVNFEKEGTIGIVDANGVGSIYVELPNGSVGNGIRFDKENNMFIADYVNHNILKIPNDSKDVEVYAHNPNMNQPNDLTIAPNGTIYASDPNWSDNTGNLWKVSENGFELLESNMGTTNGIEVSPDGKRLYVNESVQRKIWVYDIDEQNNVTNKRVFYSFNSYGLDGMRCDVKGNLFVCRYGAGKVVVINPNGKMIREITLKGKNPTNITFGGTQNKQCFVTIQEKGSIETFYSKFPGR